MNKKKKKKKKKQKKTSKAKKAVLRAKEREELGTKVSDTHLGYSFRRPASSGGRVDENDKAAALAALLAGQPSSEPLQHPLFPPLSPPPGRQHGEQQDATQHSPGPQPHCRPVSPTPNRWVLLLCWPLGLSRQFARLYHTDNTEYEPCHFFIPRIICSCWMALIKRNWRHRSTRSRSVTSSRSKLACNFSHRGTSAGSR